MMLNIFKATVCTNESKEFLFPTLRICRILSGEFDWQIGQHTVPMQSGDLILLNNLVSRRIINPEGRVLEIEIFEFSPTHILNRKQLSKMFYREQPVTVSSAHKKLIGDLLSVLSEAHNTYPASEASAHLLQAAFDLLEQDAPKAPAGLRYSFAVPKAVEFIWAHACEEISVPDVAKHLNISKNHLEKLFKDIHGIGVGAYIRTIRVYNALSLLEKEPERTVLDIALSCGFSSSSGFYKAYKTVTGHNPRRVRPKNELPLQSR